MADRKRHIETACRDRAPDKTRHFPHLKPLSVYSRMAFRKATSSCSDGPSWGPAGPSCSLRVELSNSRAVGGRKRRLDDSCLDETYDTPLKKPCLAKRPSPDSACVLDSSDTLRQVKFVSLQSSSVALEEIKRIEKTLSARKSLDLDWINGSDKTDGERSVSLTDVHSSSPVIVRNKVSADVLAFDCDVDEIMCLSPIHSADVSADVLEDFIQSCQTSNEKRRPAEEGPSLWRGSKQTREKSECSIGKDAQTSRDEGYVTKSFWVADPKESKDTMESELAKSDETYFMKSYKISGANLSNDETPPESLPVVSTPLAKFRELIKRSPTLTKLYMDRESWSCEVVKSSSTCSSSVNLDAGDPEALPTNPFLSNDESKEGKVVFEGMPIHKSLVCHNQKKQTATQLKEDEDEDEDVLSVSQQQADSTNQVTLGEETNPSDSFESTLPLQVQVKSKVVLVNKQQPEAVKATAHQQPEKKAASKGRRILFKDVPRPVVLYREEDWEKEKKVYVDSVTRHMADNAEDGVMTELLHLMNSVANEGRGSDGRKWQHPSDLTRRNYRLRNSSRLLSLDEWQNLNYRDHRRFAKVPQVFERSQAL